MASSLRVSQILPSVGTNVAIGTDTGSVTISGTVTGVSTFSSISATNVNATTVNATRLVGVSSAGITTAYVGAINDGPISGARNRIINGDMRIDQRNAGVSTVPTAAGLYTLDRWQVYENTDGAATVQRSGVAPVGFTSSLLWTTTTADTSLASGQFCLVLQRVEGYNVSDLNWGTTDAQPVTLSFWARTSCVGIHGGCLRSGISNNRSYPFTYTINLADTWEYKTITIPGETTGLWNKDNGNGLELMFSLGSASNVSGPTGSWSSTNYYSSLGVTTSVIGATNATWYITGVQLEAGTVATPFERRIFGQELALCQRYYWRISGTGRAICNSANWSTTTAYGNVKHPVSMRITPNLEVSNGADFIIYANSVPYTSSSAVLEANSNDTVAEISVNTTGLTSGQASFIRTKGTGTPYIGFISEL